MDKVQIDKAVQILRRMAETGEFNYISQLNQLIGHGDVVYVHRVSRNELKLFSRITITMNLGTDFFCRYADAK